MFMREPLSWAVGWITGEKTGFGKQECFEIQFSALHESAYLAVSTAEYALESASYAGFS
ncbi:MAG: hypothetical protein OHK0041_06200 [Anaerolineales bacterium]